ncbi:MAG: A24 family peptidase [Planctomycetaceae bacterium]|nr:A24 family peptidase [Planctomycetaceae bacterium]
MELLFILYPVLFAAGFVCGMVINQYAARNGLTQKNYSSQRTLAVNLFCAFGICLLYYWEVQLQALSPELAGYTENPSDSFLRFAAHSVFFALLLAASLIDWDDMVIPEQLTVFGTLAGLILAAMSPQTLLPSIQMKYEYYVSAVQPVQYEFVYTVLPKPEPLHVASPHPSEILWKNQKPQPEQIGKIWLSQNGGQYQKTMTALWLFWCFAMLPRVWYRKLSLQKKFAIFCRYLYRIPSTKFYIAAALIGTALIWFAAYYVKTMVSDSHAALLSSLTGIAVGMSIIWATRLIAGGVLKQEAMGFGDVMLMGMIGAFAGWQPCLMIFFLAPLTGLVLWTINALMGRWREFPYGPNLCLATVIVFLAWKPIWAAAAPLYFDLGWYIGVIMFICLVMLGVLLSVWCFIRKKLFGF